jgi:transposase
MAQQLGPKGLKAKAHPGPRPKLTARQRQKLQRLLLKGPPAHGYRTDHWTLMRIAELIEEHFVVRYDPSGVWHVLRGIGGSGPRPEGRAREPDGRTITRGRQQDPLARQKSPTSQP